MRRRDPYGAALLEVSKKRPDLERARHLLEAAWRAGNPNAAYALGTWYLHGHGVEQDIEKAFQLLRQAAKGNVPDALFDLAVCYEKGEGTRANPTQAFECYLSAALRGEEQSYYEVGRCLYHGIGTAKSTRLARIWLDRSREFGASAVPTGRLRSAPSRKPGGAKRSSTGV